MSDKVVSLDEAFAELNAAREEVVDAQRQLHEARSRECSAINRMNEAQRTFDQATAYIRKINAVSGSDWVRASSERPA